MPDDWGVYGAVAGVAVVIAAAIGVAWWLSTDPFGLTAQAPSFKAVQDIGAGEMVLKNHERTTITTPSGRRYIIETDREVH